MTRCLAVLCMMMLACGPAMAAAPIKATPAPSAAAAASTASAAPAKPAPTASAKPAPAATSAAPAASAAKATVAQASTSSASAPSTDAAFFSELGFKDWASAADAARALTILVSEGKEDVADFEAARTYLRNRGVLPDGWLDMAKADDPTEKGNLARLVCRALHIKGGLNMQLLGPLPRLALFECIYLELMVRGAENTHVSGSELVGVIDRCDRWRTGQLSSGPQPAQAKPAAEVKP